MSATDTTTVPPATTVARDLLIVSALAGGGTAEAVAKLAGCSVATVWRRLRHPANRQRLAELRASSFNAGAKRLRDEIEKSISALAALRDDPTAHDSTRARAAVSLLELAVEYDKATNVNLRLYALEALADEKTDPPEEDE
jgi:transposase